MLIRSAVVTAATLLILAAPAAAASTAAAGPSPTPLILELILAAIVISAMAIRRPIARILSGVRAKFSRPSRHTPAHRPLERRA